MENFFKCERNFIILSNSGKPIFSLNGDIYALSSIYATLYAMISKMQTFEFKKIDLKEPKRAPNSNERYGNFGQPMTGNLDSS